MFHQLLKTSRYDEYDNFILEINPNGCKGKVIDNFRSLNNKEHFRVKRIGKLGPPVLSILGVNRGGISSKMKFKKYV